MPSVKILHYTNKKNSDGTSPVIIQVIDGKVYKRTLANVFINQWDAKNKRVIPRSHPNYATINIRISNEYNRIESLILSDNFNLKRDFVDYFSSSVSKDSLHTALTFKELIPLYISQLKSGQTMVGYESRLNYFVDNAGIGNLRLSEIKKHHMDKFIKFMTDKGNRRSTMRTNLNIVGFLASFATKHGYDTKPEALNFQKPIPERSLKSKLTKDELEAFKAVILPEGSKIKEIQDMFMLAVYLRGMRIGDVIQLRQDYFKEGRIRYESHKNKKVFNIKLIPEAVEIVNRYLDGREHLFTFFTHRDDVLLSTEQNLKNKARHISNISANVNGKLKIIAEKAEPKITKNVSTHIARHTFAKMAIEKVKDFNLSMDLVGHSNIKEHQLYIREISEAEDLDNAADEIFG